MNQYYENHKKGKFAIQVTRMQTEFKECVFDFVKILAGFNKLHSLILFGSVAKGEADKRSDIDVMVILDTKEKNISRLREKKEIAKIALKTGKKHDKSIQVVFANKNLDGLDRQFIETIAKEGIILYGNIPKISTERLSLEPYFLINYNTKNVDDKNKMKLNRALYGYETRKEYKGKKYKTQVIGLVKEFEAEKIGLATLLVPYKKAPIFVKLLDNLKIKCTKLDIWISKP